MPMMPMTRPMTRPPMVARPPMAPLMAARRPGGMKKGGSAHNRADGCAERGHTKGTIVMCGGGMHKK